MGGPAGRRLGHRGSRSSQPPDAIPPWRHVRQRNIQPCGMFRVAAPRWALERSASLTQRLLDFLVGLVLAERVHRPDRGGNPADERHLQDQANDAGYGAADGEEGQPGEKEGDQQAHSGKEKYRSQAVYMTKRSPQARHRRARRQIAWEFILPLRTRGLTHAG